MVSLSLFSKYVVHDIAKTLHHHDFKAGFCSPHVNLYGKEDNNIRYIR